MNKSISFSSCKSQHALVQSFIDEIAVENKLDKEKQNDIYIAITEAVNNAIIHGNQHNTSKKVMIDFLLEGEQLKFTVKDEGCGFNPDLLEDPTLPENISKPRGRGVFIMKHLSSHLNILKNGCVVELIFDK